jgi:hypothetical protein
VRRRSPFALGAVLVAVLIAGCGQATYTAAGSSVSATSSTPAPAVVNVASCPVPAADYAGTPYSPQAAPATTTLPASVTLPGNAQIFGTTFLAGSTSYLLAQKSGACQAGLSSADGGENMTAATVPGEGVTVTISPGGAGPSTDLACPYIPAVHAADEAFRQGTASCTHPSADVIRQIPTHTAGLYAAAVLVPAQVKDPGIQGSGNGTDPTVALFTASASADAAAGQAIACTLVPAQGNICAASLRFFLATQAQIRTRMSAADLSAMQDALSSFLAEQHVSG